MTCNLVSSRHFVKRTSVIGSHIRSFITGSAGITLIALSYISRGQLVWSVARWARAIASISITGFAESTFSIGVLKL